MLSLKFVLFCAALVVLAVDCSPQRSARTLSRIHLPYLGIGPHCDKKCPQHFCDDDPAIVFGYCCGCAGIFDKLPVKCRPDLNCPLNSFLLCRDYEYMMHCCC